MYLVWPTQSHKTYVATPPQIDQGAQALSLRTSPATRYEGMNSSIQQYILGAVARSFFNGGGGGGGKSPVPKAIA